jgi:hypothetical protein
MHTSTILTLVVIPAVYHLWRRRGLEKDFGRQGVLNSRSRQYHRAQGVRPEAIRFRNRGTGL